MHSSGCDSGVPTVPHFVVWFLKVRPGLDRPFESIYRQRARARLSSEKGRRVEGGTIRRLVAEGRYEYSKHAERERQADMIRTSELEEALRTCEIIENYPDDRRGPSCLVLGFSGQRPIHAVCCLKRDPEELFLITVYDPSRRSQHWTDNYRRRRR